VLRIARETGWGYTRILGELRKLGYQSISRQTVVNILKRAGIDPNSRKGSWDELVKRHADSLWQCDFFSKRLATRLGWHMGMALVFINVATRRVWISPCTTHPNTEWIEKQAQDFLASVERNGQKVSLITRDRGGQFGTAFNPVFEQRGIDVQRLIYRSPNLNAYVERFIQSIQQECLDHFLVFSKRHFDYLVQEYMEHYHTERPHQALGNRPIHIAEPSTEGEIHCHKRLGGLLKHYCRAA
jgi:putative transposase